MRDRHGSPFEHNSMTFRISAPIFVFREFHRHRVGWSYNEASGRYMELAPVFYVPDRDRKLVQQGKPGKYEYVAGDAAQYDQTRACIMAAAMYSYDAYKGMLDAGIAREVARTVLPVGLYSHMYATCNARSLMHFLALRTHREDARFVSHPQREIEMVAEQLEERFAELFPATWMAFQSNGRVAP
jgi:thymidylate synthase (FAD)